MQGDEKVWRTYVVVPFGNRNEKENLSLYSKRGCENCPERTQREANALCVFPLQNVALVETSHISLDDRVAAQIDFVTSH